MRPIPPAMLLVLVPLSVALGQQPSPRPAARLPARPPMEETARPVPLDSTRAHRGKAVYARYCASCHGEQGDGRGDSAPWVDPAPRDFTRGLYKCRSTPSGSLPTDEDLLRTLRRGIYRTHMPGWAVLGERNLRDLTEYLKTFSPRWREEAPGPTLRISPEPGDSVASRKRGAELYSQLGCITCHGEKGRGDGASAPTLVDDWGRKSSAYDFAAGHPKCGDQPEDLYRTLMTGLNGTPMPSYAGPLNEQEAWHLVHYMRTLGEKK